MTSATHVPIIIVSYRNPKDVSQCLAALQELTANISFDIYLCENGGTTAFHILVSSLVEANGPCNHDIANPIHDQMPQFLQVRYLRLRNRDVRVVVAEAKENFGYGGAINAWLRVLLTLSGWQGVWILNPDTRPEPRALAELVAWSAARRRGMVGSRIVEAAQPEVVQTRGLRWRPLRASTEGVDKFAKTAVEPNLDALEAYIEAPSGVSIYVTRGCIERIGLMDEQYFLYFEDLDWGYRAKNSCGIGYAHGSVVAHHGGTTIGSGSGRATASPLSVYLEFRNRVNFVRQHHRSWMTWTLLILVFRSLEYAMVGAFINVRAALMGLKAGAAGETGRPDSVFDFHGGAPNLRKRAGLTRVIPIRQCFNDEQGRGSIDGAVKRRVKIAISLTFHLVTGLVRFLRRIVGRPGHHRLVILYYHVVPPCLRASFARQLETLSARVTVVPADYQGEAARGGHSVAITFDDALTSVLENGIPELRARNMPATIFVPAGSLSRAVAWEVEDQTVYSDQSVAAADMLRTVISDRIQLGAHTLTHLRVSRLPKEEARREITGCRELMRDIFGIDTRIFAFPYGEHDATSVEPCREAGYHRVFTNVPKTVDPGSNEFIRGRVLADPADGPLVFYLKMSGAYAWMAYVTALKRWFITGLRQASHLSPLRCRYPAQPLGASQNPARRQGS